MDYFMQFHWWYVLIAIVLLMKFTGKGGMVVESFEAEMQILDPRFEGCEPSAEYKIFKKGQPHRIDLEVENLTLPVGDSLSFILNGKLLGEGKVDKSGEAEFEHWADEEGITFPQVKAGDVLVIQYQNKDVLKGTFERR